MKPRPVAKPESLGQWQCVRGCGACCHLDPSDRPELDQYLGPEDLAHYLSLVGEDGWCIHFDQTSRLCQIYSDRPWFCRVQADSFGTLYGIAPEELNDFAIDCCEQQIAGVYGEDSPEMTTFTTAVRPEGED